VREGPYHGRGGGSDVQLRKGGRVREELFASRRWGLAGGALSLRLPLSSIGEGERGIGSREGTRGMGRNIIFYFNPFLSKILIIAPPKLNF
jgi:hypothetical protein